MTECSDDLVIIRVSFRKMDKGGAKQYLWKMGGGGGGKGSAREIAPSRGSGGILSHKILNPYPQRCIFRLFCGSQMT